MVVLDDSAEKNVTARSPIVALNDSAEKKWDGAVVNRASERPCRLTNGWHGRQ